MFKILAQVFFLNGLMSIALCIQFCITPLPAEASVKPQFQEKKQKKRHVTINQQKFELISQQNDHWLLYDPQVGQYCITLNQLVVVTADLEPLLNQVSWPYNAAEWDVLAKHTYRWSGAFNSLLKLHNKLKDVSDIRLEWQLQYLPLSKAAKM